MDMGKTASSFATSTRFSTGEQAGGPAAPAGWSLPTDDMRDAAARVLIVEDEAIIAWELRTLVEGFGYEVCGMSGKAADAVRLAEETEPDLVLMDVRLSGSGDSGRDDGVSAAAQIKARRPVPVVFCTAFADPGTVARIDAVGPAGLLRKPIAPRDLESLLKSVLSSRVC